jgi:hypothetical protein
LSCSFAGSARQPCKGFYAVIWTKKGPCRQGLPLDGLCDRQPRNYTTIFISSYIRNNTPLWPRCSLYILAQPLWLHIHSHTHSSISFLRLTRPLFLDNFSRPKSLRRLYRGLVLLLLSSYDTFALRQITPTYTEQRFHPLWFIPCILVLRKVLDDSQPLSSLFCPHTLPLLAFTSSFFFRLDLSRGDVVRGSCGRKQTCPNREVAREKAVWK